MEIELNTELKLALKFSILMTLIASLFVTPNLVKSAATPKFIQFQKRTIASAEGSELVRSFINTQYDDGGEYLHAMRELEVAILDQGAACGCAYSVNAYAVEAYRAHNKLQAKRFPANTKGILKRSNNSYVIASNELN